MPIVEVIPPWAWWAIPSLLIIFTITRGRGGSGQKDPLRGYPPDFRHLGASRAGNQCEYSTPWFTRCTRTAQHADHFYPHTRGGSTSMRNLVASCATHNLSKGARMPSAWTRIRIEHRRKKYFPNGLDRTVGQWFS